MVTIHKFIRSQQDKINRFVSLYASPGHSQNLLGFANAEKKVLLN